MIRTLFASALVLAVSAAAHGQTIDPFYAGNYSYVNLGSAPNVPTAYGGLVGKAGDANTLLLGGAANGESGAVYNVGVNRTLVNGLMRITSFSGSSSQYSTAPQIDGGLTYAPNGNLLFTGYSGNQIGQIKPGSTSPDLITTLSSYNSVGSLLFAPGSTPASGNLKVLSYNASVWYTVAYTLNASTGLYAFGTPTNPITLSGGLEGAVYVPGGSALFSSPSVLVDEYLTGAVAAYTLDANNDPIASSRRVFISGLSGVEGAYIDPSTGDFLFSTYGGNNQVIAVRGFQAVPEPSAFAALGLGSLALLRRRRA